LGGGWPSFLADGPLRCGLECPHHTKCRRRCASSEVCVVAGVRRRRCVSSQVAAVSSVRRRRVTPSHGAGSCKKGAACAARTMSGRATSCRRGRAGHEDGRCSGDGSCT